MSACLNTRDRESLKQELDLLQILYHRNKNQHRGASWFKHLKYLKSALTRITSIPHIDDFVKPSKKFLPELQNHSEHFKQERAAFLNRSRALYYGFTAIIATWQYVSLGMILLAILARVWKIVLGPIELATLTDDSDVYNDELDVVEAIDFGEVIARFQTEYDENTTHETMVREPILMQKAELGAEESLQASRPIKRSATIALVNHELDSCSTKKKQKLKKKKKKQTGLADEIDAIFG